MELEKSIKYQRARFPILKEKTYFLTPSTGLIPDFVYDVVKAYQDDRYYNGGNSIWNGMSTLEMIKYSKMQIGKMIGCKWENISFGDNSSRMLNLFINGIGLVKGDNVIITEDAFISNKYAWQMKEAEGIKIKYVKSVHGIISAESIFEAVNDKTKVISLCYVESATGFKHDIVRIGKFCKEKDIYLCVDGVQAIGVLPIDVKKMNIDYMVGTDYKWMMHYCGTGFAYISDQLLHTLKSWGAGWMSDKDRFNIKKKYLELRDDAGKYEMGYPNVAGIYSLGLVAENYLKLGGTNIEEYVNELRDYLINKIKLLQGISLQYTFQKNNLSQIIKLRIRNTGEDLFDCFAKNNIALNCEEENQEYVLRVGLHYYNNKEDIDHFIHVIKEYSEQRSCKISCI